MNKYIQRMINRGKEKGGPLLIFLGILSILGVLYTALRLLFDMSLGNWVNVTIHILVGVGLITESRIRLFKPEKDKSMMKLVTFWVGLFYLLAGIIQIPQLGIDLTPWLLSLGVLNIVVLIVTIWEVFYLK